MAETRVSVSGSIADSSRPLFRDTKTSDLLVVGTIVVLAAGLRIVFIRQSLWFDEFASVFFTTQPMERLWSSWMIRESNPPLFYSILKLWSGIGGTLDRGWLRIPSIASNLAAIVVVFFGIRAVYGQKAAAVAACMLALSGHQIAYALQVRCYSTLFLALVISFVGLVRIVTAGADMAKTNMRGWVLYVGGAIAAIYLHTTAIFWPVIASLSLILVDRRFVPLRGSRWLVLALVDAAIVAGSSWWLYITYRQIIMPNGNLAWLAPPGVSGALHMLYESVFLVREIYGTSRFMPVVLMAFVAFGIGRTWRAPATRLTVVCFAVSVVTYIAISSKQPIMVERSLVWMAIFPATLVAAGLGTIASQRLFYLAAAVVLAMLSINIAKQHDFQQEEWRSVIATIARDPKAVLVVDGEGLGVVADAACRVERPGMQPCPFPILTLNGPGQRYNGWAHGAARRADIAPDGGPRVREDANLYFVQRWQERAFEELAGVGFLSSPAEAATLRAHPPFRPTFLLGPYSGTAVDAFRARVVADEGLLRVMPARTLVD